MFDKLLTRNLRKLIPFFNFDLMEDLYFLAIQILLHIALQVTKLQIALQMIRRRETARYFGKHNHHIMAKNNFEYSLEFLPLMILLLFFDLIFLRKIPIHILMNCCLNNENYSIFCFFNFFIVCCLISYSYFNWDYSGTG